MRMGCGRDGAIPSFHEEGCTLCGRGGAIPSFDEEGAQCGRGGEKGGVMSQSKPQSAMKMVPRNALEQNVTLRTIEAAAERLKNWGKWGLDDELGTLNYVAPEDIVKAAALVRKGKAFSLGLDFNQFGPQRSGWGGRFNPIHTMLATGTDAVAGAQESMKIGYADDMVTMPLQCGTQWDAL